MDYLFFNNRLILFYLVILLAGCTRSMNPDVERGSELLYQEGYPDVRLSALGYLNLEDEAVVQVTTEIVYGSLVFLEVNGSEISEISLSINIINQETGYTYNIQQDFEIKSNRDIFEIREELFTYIREVKVEHGNYSVMISAIDKLADKEFIQQTEAYVPDPASNEINLTAIRLSGKRADISEAQFSPVTTYNVTSSLDSLKFDFQVTNNDSDQPLTIQSQLIRYNADLNPSQPLYDRNPVPSEIIYRGIDYRDYTVVDDNVRRLDQPGSVLIEFKYPLLNPGNYRFEVTTTDYEGNDHYKARDFAIRGLNFPTMNTPRELAKPLIYLMSRSEHQRLMAIEDSHELKESIDRFWLSNIGSMRRARLVINLFYDRVETANKRYTNFKEGWKTDRGKVYILFGSPWYTDSIRNRLIWSYTHNPNDPLYNFTFWRVRSQNEFFPFEHYRLRRDRGLYNLEYRQRQLWLTGAIIDRRL